MQKQETFVGYYHGNKLSKYLTTASQETTILVDFDETLLLRNSTAEYLNNLQPRFLAALLLKTISFLRPWKLLIKSPERESTRDWFLVFIITILMPWNILLWSNKAKQIAEQYSNYDLIQQLNQSSSGEVIVASLGFNFIIEPILKLMSVKYKQLIACRLRQGLQDRQKGKLAMVQESIGIDRVSSAIAITDSLDDLPLLTKVAQPFLIVWDKSQYISPMSDLYIPMMYLHKIKRVGENYIAKAILFDDLPVFLLSLTWLSSQPFLHGLGILALVFSFWCIYEFGYYENDLVAEKYEHKPVLSETYCSSQVTINWWQPWIWSLILGSIGTLLVVASKLNLNFEQIYLPEMTNKVVSASIIPFGAWIGFLLVSRLCFWVYNYVNKPTRIWLYTVLQLCRYCGFLVIAKTNLIGMSLLLGQILSRSISYIVYRYSGGNKTDWPKLQEKFLRWLLFIVFIVSLSLTQKDDLLILNWQTGAIFLWCLFRGAKHIKEAIDNIGLIKQEKVAL